MSKSKEISFKNRDKYLELGLNIAFYRKRAGMTQETLSEKVGISRSYLSTIEAPNIVCTFSFEVLFDIADALNLPPYKLMVFRE